jgi:hypothetical protein
MASSPIVVGETVVFPVESDSESFAVGLSVKDGSNRWKIGASRSDRIGLHPWRSGDVAFLSGAGLNVVETSSGKQKWAFGGGSSMSSATLADGIVIRSHEEGTTVLRPPAGAGEPEVVWQNNQALSNT